MRCSAYDRRWATTRYKELIRIADMILWFGRRYCKVVQVKSIIEARMIHFSLFRFLYLIWQMSGWDFITVSWQLPVPSYGSGWFGFTKYVPLSRAIPPQDAITARRFFFINFLNTLCRCYTLTHKHSTFHSLRHMDHQRLHHEPRIRYSERSFRTHQTVPGTVIGPIEQQWTKIKLKVDKSFGLKIDHHYHIVG